MRSRASSTSCRVTRSGVMAPPYASAALLRGRREGVQTAEAPVAAALDDDPHRFPTVDGVVAAFVGLLGFLIAVRPALDNDLWFHLRTAEWMVDHHRWVGADPFTYT